MISDRPYDLFSSNFFRNSHEILARMRQDGPVHRGPVQWGRPSWFVVGYDEVETVLRDSGRFALDFRMAFDPDALKNIPQDPQVIAMVNNHLLTKEGEDHRRLRALVSKAFTPARVAALRPQIQAIADELLDRVQAEGEMDLVESYAFPLPIIVIADLLGIPANDRDKFREWSDAFVGGVDENDTGFYGAAMGFVGYLGQVFEERRQNPRDDMISALLQAEEAGDRLNIEELFSMVVLLIIAGHETTVSLIGNATVILLTHPEAAAQLRAHPEHMPRAVEEFLRLESPVERSITRWVTQDTTLGGQQLHRGDIITVMLGSANRDEKEFPNPNQLDLSREPNPHLAFGKGAHYCLGSPLARMEGEVALNTLLRRLPGLRLQGDKKDLKFRETPLFHAYTRIPVEWDK